MYNDNIYLSLYKRECGTIPQQPFMLYVKMYFLLYNTIYDYHS